MKIETTMPLVWYVAIAGIAAGFHLLGIPAEMTTLIVGAGLTRVKVQRPNGNIDSK